MSCSCAGVMMGCSLDLTWLFRTVELRGDRGERDSVRTSGFGGKLGKECGGVWVPDC